MKNTLVDLQNHIFAAIERMGDETITGEEARLEIAKGMALSSLAKDAQANALLMAKMADIKEITKGLPILPDTRGIK